MTATLTPNTTAGVDTWCVDDVDFAALLGSPVGLSSRELGDRLVELDRVRRRLEAATVAVLDEAERSDAYRDDGCISLGSWARCQVLWSKREATVRVQELDLVRLCPEVSTALERGSLGVAQVAELARVRANPRVGEQIVEDITQLLGWAAELDFGGFCRVVRRWEQLADADGAAQGHDRAHRGRRASLNSVDDTFHLSAQFGVVQGTAMATILDAFVEAEWQADWDAVKAEHGELAATNMVARSQSQRRADAVYAIFVAAVTGKGPSITKPLVHLVCDLATFEDHVADTVDGHTPNPTTTGVRRNISGDPGDPGDAGDPLAVSIGTGFAMRRCETVNGDPVHPQDVLAAALIGHVRMVVVDRRGVVVDAGRKTRLFRGVPRELVWLLGKTCSWRGCDHRVDLQVDHLDEYVRDDGRTDQGNAGILHGAHNRIKTAHGYRITRDPNGILHTWRPDGTELKPR